MSKIQVHENICKSLNELYARKNADYGDSFGESFKEYGLTMSCIRLGDKLNRIKSLSKQAAQVSDESITDTLMDLANYSIMTLVELEQGETHTAPEKAPRGIHCEDCVRDHPECLCATCAHDDWDADGGWGDDCCTKHNYHKCSVTECPDYVKEG